MKAINSFLIFLFSIMFITSCSNNIKTFKKNYSSLKNNEKEQVDSYLKDAEKMFNKKNEEIVLILQYNCFSGKKVQIGSKEEVYFKKEDEKLYSQKISKINKNEESVRLSMDGKSINIKFVQNYDYILVCYYDKEKTWNIMYYDFPKIIIPN